MSIFGEIDRRGVTLAYVPNSTDMEAEQALKEQKYGDEFKPYQPANLQACVDRLNEVDTEISNLQAKLWGKSTFSTGVYKGPQYLERENLRRQIDELERERDSLQAYLRDVIVANGLHTDAGGPYTSEPSPTVVGSDGGQAG